MPEQRLPRLLRDRTAHEAGGDRCQREARTSKRALHVTSKELWVARAHFPSPCPKHEIFVQGGVRIPCMWAHGCDLHHQANARVPRARISYIASPVSRHRVTLPNPLPDDSWAVDERSLKLFVDKLQEPPADRAWYELRREAERIALVPGFDRLITLDANAIKELPHQIDVAQRVLRDMGGRAILADEVGLGKTIEASIVYKELAVRGLARRALILTPASLVGQWQGELEEKFFERFETPTDPDDWQRGAITRAIPSHDRARSRRHAEEILRHRWDLVIVDEAHKVKSHRGATYQVIEKIERDFILLLTATPLQNDLRELYNLITLLRPGQLGTWQEFKSEHLVSGDQRQPRDPEALRALPHAG